LVLDGKYNYPAGEAVRFSIGVMSIYDSPEKQWRRVLHSSFQLWGISLATTDARGRTFLYFLADLRTGNDLDPKTCEQIAFLLGQDRSLVYSRDTKGRTLLYYAARSGSEEIARSLLCAGADPLCCDKQGTSVLYFVA